MSAPRKKKWKNSWRSASPITKGTFIVADAVAAATIAYSIIAGLQLAAIRGQLREMQATTLTAQESADTADKSILLAQKTERDSRKSTEDQARQSGKALDASIDNFRQDQRAWVSVKNARLTKPFSTTEKAQVTVLVTNTGHTPALKMYFSCRGMKLDAEPTCDSHLGKGEVFKSPVSPGGENEQFVLIDPQSQALIDGLKNKTHSLYLKLGLEYWDINGKVHHTTFCGSYPSDHEPFLMGCPNGGTMD